MVTTEIARQAHGEQPAERAGIPHGYLITTTSRVAQRALDVDRPAFEELDAADFHPEHHPIATLSTTSIVQTGLAFVLGGRLAGPVATMANAVRAVDHVLLAADVIGAPGSPEGPRRAVVLGTRPFRVDGIDLRLAGCLVHRNGELVETGAGGVMLGSPLNALLWLANDAHVDGLVLQAGQVVLVCSMTRPVHLAAGGTVAVSLSGSGSVTAVLAS